MTMRLRGVLIADSSASAPASCMPWSPRSTPAIASLTARSSSGLRALGSPPESTWWSETARGATSAGSRPRHQDDQGGRRRPRIGGVDRRWSP